MKNKALYFWLALSLLAFFVVSSGFRILSPGQGTKKPVRPAGVMLTCYSTTLLANGRDQTRVRIAVTDSAMNEIPGATDSIRLYVTGDGRILAPGGSPLMLHSDTAGTFYPCRLENGICRLVFAAGTKPGKIKVEATPCLPISG